tara:strand:+ start:446 stop:868 length:423 start_codon:yes stop_codon:yes gene_type:complete
MSKNIFILNSPNDVNPFKDQATFDPVSISNLDQLTNNYYNIICVTCIEDVDLENRDKIFQSIITKLRPSGEAIIIINDKKNLCRLYLDNVIDDNMFVSQIAQSRYAINEKNILDSLQDHFNVIHINKNNGKIVLHLGKKQ